jgi:hypothetical protein
MPSWYYLDPNIEYPILEINLFLPVEKNLVSKNQFRFEIVIDRVCCGKPLAGLVFRTSFCNS